MLYNTTVAQRSKMHKLMLPLFPARAVITYFLPVAYKTRTAGNVTGKATAKITKPSR